MGGPYGKVGGHHPYAKKHMLKKLLKVILIMILKKALLLVKSLC